MAKKENTHEARASATGYLYQCRIALLLGLRAIPLTPDLEISVEKFDDVAFDTNGTPSELIQTKHHIGSTGNLSNASSDLWNTLLIWVKAAKADVETPFRTKFILLTTGIAPTDSAASFLRTGSRDEQRADKILCETAAESSSKENKDAYAEYTSLPAENRISLLQAITILDSSPSIVDVFEELVQELHYSAPKDQVPHLVERRADSSVCAIDRKTLARKTCGHIDSTPDGVVYVAPTKEVWVTAPRDKSVRILDSQTLSQKEKLTFEGRPEGYAVDAKRGRLYMNYEDKDLTTAIDLKTHKTVAKWPSSCGEDGPHGISVDEKAGFLFVACSTHAEVLDGHNGEKVSSIDTGDGVDDINYSPATHTLYVGAAKDGRLTVARVDAAGKLSLIAQIPTHEGARNGIVTKDGTVYLAHSQRGQLAGLIVASPREK